MKRLSSLLWVPLFFVACHTSYRPASLSFRDYRVTDSAGIDLSYNNYLKPFRDSMQVSMGEVLGSASRRMDVKRPATTLGNFLADAYLDMAREKFDPSVQVAVMNLGGIRKPYLEAGPITRGMVFEVMPFDNLMTLVTVNGEQLKAFLDASMAEGGGVAGMSFTTNGKRVRDVLVNGKPLDPGSQYTLVTSDYAAGDPRMAWFYGPARKQQTNYLLRDCIMDYTRKMGRLGKPIGEQLDKRIQSDK